ncbi:MAG TPA: MOSC domain-containing protein [Anaerolineales bacterium]
MERDDFQYESRGGASQAGQGSIFQVNLSAGGVPKHGQARAQVTLLGLDGDRQATPEVHGGPERALCLYSLERILELQAEGHPVFPGAMGENLTITGLDWPHVVPGCRLRLGSEVLLEVTRYTNPCNSLVPFFMEGDYSRVSQKHNPGWSRVYVRVLQPGEIQVGDSVQLLVADRP